MYDSLSNLASFKDFYYRESLSILCEEARVAEGSLTLVAVKISPSRVDKRVKSQNSGNEFYEYKLQRSAVVSNVDSAKGAI